MSKYFKVLSFLKKAMVWLRVGSGSGQDPVKKMNQIRIFLISLLHFYNVFLTMKNKNFVMNIPLRIKMDNFLLFGNHTQLLDSLTYQYRVADPYLSEYRNYFVGSGFEVETQIQI